MVKTVGFPRQRVQVQSLVKELRSHVLHDMAKVIIIITKRNQIGLKQFLVFSD